jgi:hypothetical protein
MSQPQLLSPQQVQAAHLLASGIPYTQAAKQLGIGRCTLYRWRQEPQFLTYYHQLLKEIADQAAARSLQMLIQAQDLIQQQLSDPSTPIRLRANIALRLMAISTKQIQQIQKLPDDPEAIAVGQYRQYLHDSGQEVPEDIDGSEAELHRLGQKDLMAYAQAFDQRYPDPLNLKTGTIMNQNEPSAHKSIKALDQAIAPICHSIAQMA